MLTFSNKWFLSKIVTVIWRMYKLFLSSLVIFVMLFSCSDEKDKTTSVYLDCTGAYIRVEDKDYHVCNPDKLTGYEHGAKVNVKFERIRGCPSEDDRVVCRLYHENEGWVNVIEVEPA
jgi:hypothetical protein